MQAVEEEARRRQLSMQFNPGRDHADQSIQDYKVSPAIFLFPLFCPRYFLVLFMPSVLVTDCGLDAVIFARLRLYSLHKGKFEPA